MDKINMNPEEDEEARKRALNKLSQTAPVEQPSTETPSFKEAFTNALKRKRNEDMLKDLFPQR